MGFVFKRRFVNGMFLIGGLFRFFINLNIEEKFCLRVCEFIEDVWGYKRSGKRVNIWVVITCLSFSVFCRSVF